MLINAMAIKSAFSVIDKREIREHLKAVCFNYDAASGVLTIVGTDAQCMIINKVHVGTDAATKAFCEKWFSDNSAYFINDACLGKMPYCDFIEMNNNLMCNGTILEKLGVSYPNWRAIVPEKNLEYATKYCGFRADLIKKIDKALGYKNNRTIITEVPRVNADDEQEFLCAHRWDLHEFDKCDTIVLCMPMRLNFNN